MLVTNSGSKLFEHRGLESKRFNLMLCELRNVEVVANLYLTRHRWDLPKQKAQQRGLASPIRANERQLLASLNDQVDVAQHGLTIKAHAGILGFDYNSGRSLGWRKTKPS
jgi:hypothetical protein